jgi:predicted RecB family nuclease
MNKIITSNILVAYSQCPRKASLLMCSKKRGSLHEYTKILELQRQRNQFKYLEILQNKHSDIQTYTQDNLTNGYNFLINVKLKVNRLSADSAILTKVETPPSVLGGYSYEPTIFVGTYSIKKEQKLELFFVSYILAQIQKNHPTSGFIIGLDEKSHKVKFENSTKTLIPVLDSLQEWIKESSLKPLPIILNKHCPNCQFQSLCRTEAEQEDNLSMLDCISTAKLIKKYEDKGIFTVKQLSYIFKQRKRKKRAYKKLSVTHKPELQALAIREKKIYLQELPELTRQKIEFFLDIEGVPDQHFYYLFGVLLCEGGNTTYNYYWANTRKEETQIWQNFLEKVNQYPNAPIYHYGSYDSRAITKLTDRFETDVNNIIHRLVNVNSHIFGKVYFPVYSNRLKEIGKFIGASWTSPNASGLQTLVWRHYWDETYNDQYKGLLVTYNQEDCKALKLLTDELSKIKNSAYMLSEVDFANQPKIHATEVGKQVHSQFDNILRFAQTNYDKNKITFRQNQKDNSKKRKKRNKPGPKKGYIGHRKVKPKTTKVVKIQQRKFCPNHVGVLLKSTEKISSRQNIDLILMKNGIKKVITEYVGVEGYCSKCGKSFVPPTLSKYKKNQLYGHGFKAWQIYNRVALRMPYLSIVEILNEQFNERTPGTSIPNFIREFAVYYSETENLIVQRLLNSPFIHVDETPVNMQNGYQYVWVFTNKHYTIFKLTETREATVVHDFLADYNGILISDFYPGYDSVKCKQQKCWSHLIRELNDDLWKAPFDNEYEEFVLEVRNLILPIMETVQIYGLKKRNLNKFKKQVEKFYNQMIFAKKCKSELVFKYQERFIRYQQSLFTFLEGDNIPWHNNTAEIALRHLCVQEKISGFFYDSLMSDYLLLLGIKHTCHFQNKSFFKFLFSGETNIDKFEARKRKQFI